MFTGKNSKFLKKNSTDKADLYYLANSYLKFYRTIYQVLFRFISFDLDDSIKKNVFQESIVCLIEPICKTAIPGYFMDSYSKGVNRFNVFEYLTSIYLYFTIVSLTVTM